MFPGFVMDFLGLSAFGINPLRQCMGELSQEERCEMDSVHPQGAEGGPAMASNIDGL